MDLDSVPWGIRMSEMRQVASVRSREDIGSPGGGMILVMEVLISWLLSPILENVGVGISVREMCLHRLLGLKSQLCHAQSLDSQWVVFYSRLCSLGACSVWVKLQLINSKFHDNEKKTIAPPLACRRTWRAWLPSVRCISATDKASYFLIINFGCLSWVHKKPRLNSESCFKPLWKVWREQLDIEEIIHRSWRKAPSIQCE